MPQSLFDKIWEAHEVADGILYIDHMSAVERLACAAKLKKLAKQNGGTR